MLSDTIITVFLTVILLTVVVLTVVMLTVVMLNVVVLSVEAPYLTPSLSFYLIFNSIEINLGR
jgi:hypothetical protein